jgi:hypothetical protein
LLQALKQPPAVLVEIWVAIWEGEWILAQAVLQHLVGGRPLLVLKRLPLKRLLLLPKAPSQLPKLPHR